MEKTAEEKWRNYLLDLDFDPLSYSYETINLYKQALKEAIEKRRPHDGTGASMSVEEILGLIDHVEPPKP